jgi:dissimilatory sulfite reductase (desulfoviridin) alpha/beta subunit
MLPTYFPLSSGEMINDTFTMHIVPYKSSINVAGCSSFTGRERDAQCQEA